MIHYASEVAPLSELLHHRGMAEADEQDVFTNAEIRRRRLVQLAGLKGGIKGVAATAAVSEQNLSHIVKRQPQGTARADGTRPPVVMGDKLARTIEDAYGLAPGWLDWPFEAADFEVWATLNRYQRAYAEGQIALAIRDAAKQSVSIG